MFPSQQQEGSARNRYAWPGAMPVSKAQMDPCLGDALRHQIRAPPSNERGAKWTGVSCLRPVTARVTGDRSPLS